MTDYQPEDRLACDANLPALDPAVRAQILAATTTHIRRRRHRTRLVQAAAVALAFLSGVLATLAAQNVNRPLLPADRASQPAPTDAPNHFAAGSDGEFDSRVFDDPEALAFAYDAADQNGRLQLLKAAGDYELEVQGDIRASLDYYRQWIRLADESARQKYDQSDTWLLASLKHLE